MQAFDCIEQLLVTICLQDITLTTNWLQTIACKLVNGYLLAEICLRTIACYLICTSQLFTYSRQECSFFPVVVLNGIFQISKDVKVFFTRHCHTTGDDGCLLCCRHAHYIPTVRIFAVELNKSNSENWSYLPCCLSAMRVLLIYIL